MDQEKPKKTRSRGEITEALVLVCSRTPLVDVLGVEALRTAVSLNYLDMVPREGVLDLKPFWKVLEEQPGFHPDPAIDALCKFKSWENALGLNIILPGVVDDIKLRQRHEYARRVQVKDSELDAILGATREPDEDDGKGADEFAGVAAATPTGLRRFLPFVAGAVAAIGFVVAGFFLYSNLRGPRFEGVEVAKFTAELPVKNAKKLGANVNATLTDPSWLDLSNELRTKQLRAAFEGLEKKGVRSLVILDEDKVARASVQLAGNPPRPQVSFY